MRKTDKNSPIIHFFLLMDSNPPSYQFNLKNLPQASKIDVIARAWLALKPIHKTKFAVILTAGFLKPGEYFTTVMIKDDPETISPRDELAIAAYLREYLPVDMPFFENLPKNHINQPVVWCRHKSFAEFFQRYKNNSCELFLLDEKGIPFTKYLSAKSTFDNNMCFFLGGRKDIPQKYLKKIKKAATESISLGTKSYLASSCMLKVVYKVEKQFFS
ncbi:MAG: hypothetical protein U9O98_10615 [Asgard group archaeon]|nr:hypothetical protein [Asgard group archaeon]